MHPDLSTAANISACNQTWVRLIFSIRFNSVSESFDSDSTHDSQWLSKIDSNQLTTQNGFLEFDSNRLMTQMAFQNFDSNQLMTQKAFQQFDSNQLMTQKVFFRILIQIDS